ncbi:MAG: hypothetical protein J5610_03240 [Prevotella sp.]|nr:hypothetical protein [Prevotella sp.]
MNKQRFNTEYELQSNVESIIWSLISTPSGLQKWIADKVEEHDRALTFTWGDPDKEHETRTANMVQLIKNTLIRLRWDDEENPEAYWEIRMAKSDLTNDYILEITDYALPEDMESLGDIWQQNFEELHRSTGL